MQKLPQGRQVFEDIRKEDLLYVDKTGYIYEMLTGSGARQFFLSRPRRFGKTLMCWTLDALFGGKRELFDGLAISKTDWPWEAHPVVHIDLSLVDVAHGMEGVETSLLGHTKEVAQRCEVDVGDITLPGMMLGRIITEAAKKSGKQAVVIVDEYDKPFIEFYSEPQTAQKVRELLRSYYITFKANEHSIKFLFMTGISKFARMGVFSTLNHLTDISLDKRFGAAFGYTEAELVENFREHIEAGAKELGCSADELVDRMRQYYNGFCFDGEQRVYCPFSATNFFADYEFTNHWMISASTKMIADYMRDRSLTVEQFVGLPVSNDFAMNPGEIETAPPESFLYQSGYLTLRKDEAGEFFLDYPNTEVFESMSQLVAMSIIRSGGGNYFVDFRTPILDSLRDGDVGLFVETINRLLSCIPYDDYAHGARSAIKRSGLPAGEWLYRSSILTFLHGCGVMAIGEPHTSKGRPDLLLCYRNAVWVVEIKIAYDNDGKAKAQEALEQITAKQYAGPFKAAKKVGVAIDDAARQITEWAAG